MEGTRPATLADLPAIAGLARAAIAELTPSRGGAVWARRVARQEPLEPGLEAAVLAQDARHAAVVGTVDGVVVGYGLSHLEDVPGGDLLAVITDLYVAADARGIGVGESMMDALVAHAVEAGAIGIDAYALPGERATKNFFETFGLKARQIVVHRPLGPGSAS